MQKDNKNEMKQWINNPDVALRPGKKINLRFLR